MRQNIKILFWFVICFLPSLSHAQGLPVLTDKNFTTWTAISNSATDTSLTLLKLQTSTARSYVVSMCCFNDSTTKSVLTVRDGSTGIWQVLLGPNTISSSQWCQNFPQPLRVTANLNFQMSTTATSTVCGATGFLASF